MKSMVRKLVLFISICFWAVAGLSQTCPVAVGPGCDRIWLIENGKGKIEEGMPVHFREYSRPVGAKSLGASGSAQPTLLGYQEMAERLKSQHLQANEFVVFDLRQESHGYVGSMPLSWYYGRDQINCGRSELEMSADQTKRLEWLRQLSMIDYFSVTSEPTDQACKIGEEPKSIPSADIGTEKEVVRSLGFKWKYVQLRVADFHAPTDYHADRFVKIAKGLTERSWLHFHCAAGDGRTTTFMVLADSMRNARATSLDAIIERQAKLGNGAIDLNDYCETPWKSSWARERLWFTRAFHQYAKEQSPAFAQRFSEWKKSNGGKIPWPPVCSAAVAGTDKKGGSGGPHR